MDIQARGRGSFPSFQNSPCCFGEVRMESPKIFFVKRIRRDFLKEFLDEVGGGCNRIWDAWVFAGWEGEVRGYSGKEEMVIVVR